MKLRKLPFLSNRAALKRVISSGISGRVQSGSFPGSATFMSWAPATIGTKTNGELIGPIVILGLILRAIYRAKFLESWETALKQPKRSSAQRRYKKLLEPGILGLNMHGDRHKEPYAKNLCRGLTKYLSQMNLVNVVVSKGNKNKDLLWGVPTCDMLNQEDVRALIETLRKRFVFLTNTAESWQNWWLERKTNRFRPSSRH